MKRLLFVFLLVFIIELVHGQGFGVISVGGKRSPEYIHKVLVEKMQIIDTLSSPELKASTYHYIASCYYQLGIDSVKYYYNQAYAADSVWLCSIGKYFLNRGAPGCIPIHVPYHYFVEDFDEAYLKSFLAKCENCKNKEHNSTEQVGLLDSLFFSIKADDQKYRKELVEHWGEQNELDSINRVRLDAFYNEHGFPGEKVVNSESMETAWLVLQHSTDCQWTEKWVVRFLDAYQAGQYSGKWMGQTIQRFYGIEKGYCRQKNEEGTKLFVEFLKKKYPQSYGERFGYNHF